MGKETIDLMIEGGQAKAGPAIAQPLAPLGMNIQEVIKKINEKTSSFNGMKVPVKVTVDTEDKSFDLKVGTPPISELIKKEAGIEKGSGTPNINKVGNLAVEQIIKLTKMKQDSLLFNNFKAAVKTVAGSCNSLGVLIEGKTSSEINKDIDTGNYDSLINNQVAQVSPDKLKILTQQLTEIQERIKKEIEKAEAEKKAEEAKAKKLVAEAEAVVKEGAEEKKEEVKAEEKGEVKEEKKIKEEPKAKEVKKK
ncbi:50S ribosomal protein L11 [Candidatus Woesearchaeota archaeon]|nr:50S ribosomal protein L11 [Candidatus Woesearchaeota archaeon]